MQNSLLANKILLGKEVKTSKEIHEITNSYKTVITFMIFIFSLQYFARTFLKTTLSFFFEYMLSVPFCFSFAKTKLIFVCFLCCFSLFILLDKNELKFLRAEEQKKKIENFSWYVRMYKHKKCVNFHQTLHT